MKKKIVALLLTGLMLCMTSCTITGLNHGEVVETPQEETTSGNETEPVETEVPTETEVEEETEKEPEIDMSLYPEGAVYIDSAEDFIIALTEEETTIIVLAPGVYDLTVAMMPLWDKYGEGFKDSHKYVELRECFDGVELLVRDKDDLTILAAKEDEVSEITVDPRYATVLTFCECDNLVLQGITMGHTDRGNCVGDVISLLSCDNVTLSYMDLYGCGVNALYVAEYSDHIMVSDSTLRDCSQNAFVAENTNGRITFENCVFTGNECGLAAFYNWEDAPFVFFEKCRFGQEESNDAYFDSHIYFSECAFEEFTGEYPDYSDNDYWEEVYATDLKTLKPIAFDKDVIGNNITWSGIYIRFFGETENYILPTSFFEQADDGYTVTSLTLWEDGTGVYFECGTPYEVTWEMDGDYSAQINVEGFVDPVTLSLAAYDSGEDGREAIVWMKLGFGQATVYLINTMQER